MRSKEQDPDYRFLQDPDLPCFIISKERVEAQKKNLESTPFERKKSFAATFGL
jgi:Asp-tRNA(Asn)/Glu-tRNA(Gln) amidotransferase B subunit